MAETSTPVQKSPKRQLLGLNGLRAIACIGIVFYHLNQHRTTAGLAAWNWDLYKLMELLPMIVSFFFIIGAALHSLPFWKLIFTRDTNGENTAPIPGAKKALIDRFFRIAPAYYAALIGTFLIVWVLQGVGLPDFFRLFAGLSFLSWLHPLTFFPVEMNGPLWFVTYDVVGGLFVLALMHALVRTKRCLIPVVFTLTVGLLLALHFAFIRIPFPQLPGIVSEWFPTYNPFIFGLHFMIGTLVGALWAYQEVRATKTSVWYDGAFLLAVVALGAFAYEIRFSDIFDISFPRSPYHFPFTAILIALIIALTPSTKFAAKILDTKLSAFISKFSYSLYLWHALIIVLLCRWYFGNAALEHPQWWALTVVTFVLSFGIAWLSNQYIETPVLESRRSAK